MDGISMGKHRQRFLVVSVEREDRNRSLYFWVATVEGCLAGGYDVVVDKLFELDCHRTNRNTLGDQKTIGKKMFS